MVEIKEVVLRKSEGVADGESVKIPGVIYYRDDVGNVKTCQVEFNAVKLDKNSIDIKMIPLTEDECKPVMPFEEKIVRNSNVKNNIINLFK